MVICRANHCCCVPMTKLLPIWALNKTVEEPKHVIFTVV
jgi:hypothetical protein